MFHALILDVTRNVKMAFMESDAKLNVIASMDLSAISDMGHVIALRV